MAHKKTWQEKLKDSKDLPRIITVKGRNGPKTCVIPAPVEVDAIMRKVPKRRLITINDIRDVLAKKHSTEMTCPITTGIFAWIAAHAAHEAQLAGKKRFTPYWRTLKLNGEINSKYPDGIKKVAARLRAEGHKVVRKGKRFFVAEYEQSLARVGN